MIRASMLAASRALAALGLAASITACAAAATSLPLKVVHSDIPLGGKTDRFDYQSVDPKRRLLFIAHLGSGIVTAFNLRTNRIATQIPMIPGVHGVLAVPELGEVFATATDRNELYVISEQSFQIVAKAPAGIYPDGMTYDARDHKLFISDEAGDTVTVIDTRTNKRVATIAMGGEVGNSEYDSVSKMVLVDVQTRGDIAAINPLSNRIVHRYPLPSACENDHSLLLDTPARLAFVACDGNAKLLLLDMRTMSVLSVNSTGDGPDVLAFDVGLQRLYVASEGGVVDAFHLSSRILTPIGSGYVAFEAHSVAVDLATHDVYLPLQNVGGLGVLRIMAPTNL